MYKIKSKEDICLPGLDFCDSVHSPRKLALLEKSWAGVFRRHILATLPVKEISRIYSGFHGRPTKELYAKTGAVILQQVFNLSDDETIKEFAFSQLWHYALDCYNEDDHIISLRTLCAMRYEIEKLQLWDKIFGEATAQLIRDYGVDVSKQRIDSVHVHSNMARLGRIRLMGRVINTFLTNLKRQAKDTFSVAIPPALLEKYQKKSEHSFFGQVKPSDSEKTLQSIAEDMFFLKTAFEHEEVVSNMKSFKLLMRVFAEQCFVEMEEVKVKAAREVPSNSVQNPSDPDASYDGHKGQGYQTQIMETYSTGKGKSDDHTLNLITYVKTESASEHDSNALEPALKNLKERGILCEKGLGDTLYASNENVAIAKGYGVELIGPSPGKKAAINSHRFEVDLETYEVVACPAGKSPDEIKHSSKETITIIWYKATCENCTEAKSCPFKACKKGRKHYYTIDSMKTHLRRVFEESNEFKDEYRYRSGIEGTNSRFISMTGARRSRYRGESKMKFSQTLKALGINMFRVVTYLKKVSPKPKKRAVSFYFIRYFYYSSFHHCQNPKFAA